MSKIAQDSLVTYRVAERMLHNASIYCDRHGDEHASEILSALRASADNAARGNHPNAQAWEEIALEVASGRPMYP